MLAASPTGARGHLAWTEGPLQALARPQPKQPPHCQFASLGLPGVGYSPLPGPRRRAGQSRGPLAPNTPQTGGTRVFSLPGTYRQSGSGDTGLKLPAAGLMPAIKERVLQGRVWGQIPPAPATHLTALSMSEQHRFREGWVQLSTLLCPTEANIQRTFINPLRGIVLSVERRAKSGLQKPCRSVAAAAP